MQSKEIENKGLKRSYECTIPAADVQAMIEVELKKVGGRAKIAGFRPGKVPTKILEQRYGAAVQADVVRNLITDAVTETIKENDLRPALQPNVDESPYEKGQDLTFKFDMEILPDVPKIDYKKIKIEREVFEIKDEDIDDAMKRLAERSPEPKEMAKTAKAAKGHVVNMNFVGKVDGVLFDGGSAEDYQLELGSGQFIEGFEDQLIGMKADEEKTVEVTFPENYFNKELAAKPATFDVKLNSVSELVTPEINEEFAKARNFADLRALKEAVRDQLKKEFDNITRTNTKKALFDALEDTVTFDVPESMFKLEFDSIWAKVQEAKNEDEDLKGKSDDELREEYTAIANRRVRLGIVLADIGRTEKLSVGRDELSRALLAYAGNFPGQEQRVVEFYKTNPERLDEFRGPILEDKAVDWVFGQISYDDKPTSVKEIMDAVEAENAGGDDVPKAKKSTKKKPAAKKPEEKKPEEKKPAAKKPKAKKDEG